MLNLACNLLSFVSRVKMNRRASHAGSWYSSSGRSLNNSLEGWLQAANIERESGLRAIISPHAGYSYCGSCAAYAYKRIDAQKVKKIFILGPSHHVYLKGCALSATTFYETPLYNLKIDQEINCELQETQKFQLMSRQTDEAEHSIEMQLPYIAKAMESVKDNFTIIPVLVGSLDQQNEKLYGKIFSKYLLDPENLFVISSDFCHWGERFSYMHYESDKGEIYQSIEALDKQGMQIIESLDPVNFYQYLKTYRNTICGRHPISVMLNAAAEAQKTAGADYEFQFHDYKQSNRCMNETDSSVSYAAGSLVVKA